MPSSDHENQPGAHGPEDSQHIDYRQHAGTVLWPSNPTQLADTTICPACLTPLTSSTCASCGLDLAHPRALELAKASTEAVALLDRRIELIGNIRFDTTHATVEVSALVAPATPSLPASPPAHEHADASPPLAPLPATEKTVVAGASRRSSVQLALLIAGVSLLSVFAIFFLVYAFINFGIIWRSVIIASITVAAFISASLLRRRRLTASAEGLAVFAMVLVYLDAYALRANDFFGLHSAAGAVYWGATLTLTAVGFVLWHRLSNVRVASVVGWATLAPGIGMLAWGLGDGLESGLRVFTAFGLAALTGLAHTRVSRGAERATIERVLLLCGAFAALLAAFVTAWFVEPETDWGGTIAAGIVAAVGLGLSASSALSRHTARSTRGFGLAFATLGGVSAATAVVILAVRMESHAHTFFLVAPVLAATLVTLAFELAARKLREHRSEPRRTLARAFTFATGGAFGVLSLAALVPLSLAMAPVVNALSTALAHSWGSSALHTTLTSSGDDSGTAVLALAGALALAAATWSLTGRLGWRAPALAWGTSSVLSLIATQLPSLWFSLAGWFVLAAIALGLMWRMHTLAPAIRACLLTGLAANTTLMFITGWTSLDTWVTTTAATIGLIVASRMLARSPITRATLWGTAVALVLLGTGSLARHIGWNTEHTVIIEVVNVAALLVLASTVMLGAGALPLRALTRDDRRTTFWITAVVTGLAGTTLWATTSTLGQNPAGLQLPQPALSLVAGILTLVGLVLWVALRANATLRPERITASLAVGPTIYWIADSFARVIGLPAAALDVVPMTAALISAAGALTVTLLRPSTTPRWARELSVALVALPALLTTITAAPTAGWFTLVVAAVTVLLLSIDRDGLFTSESSRKHLAWAALVLATAGLWWRLRGDQVEAIEPYVLPLAAALLGVAVLVHRASSRRALTGHTVSSRPAPLIALAAMLMGILPLAADAITGDLTRAIIVTAVGAALLLTGSIVRGSGILRPYLDAAALAGALGVLVTPTGRALEAPPRDLTPDTWLIAMVVLLLIAAFAQTRIRDASDRWRTIASQSLGVISVVAFTTIESTGFTDLTLGTPRALATVALLGALHVVAYAIDRAPFTRAISWAALGAAAIATLIGLIVDALDPIELGTVPLALALLVTGTMRMTEDSTIRSWLPLGPGIAVLLLPSLLATASAPELWRLVALGVASVTVLVIGAVRRLQAPFLLGLAVALIHGFATFAPQIRAVYESQEWWLWAGIAGVLLVLLAVRYEKRIQNFKDVVMRIAALR